MTFSSVQLKTGFLSHDQETRKKEKTLSKATGFPVNRPASHRRNPRFPHRNRRDQALPTANRMNFPRPHPSSKYTGWLEILREALFT